MKAHTRWNALNELFCCVNKINTLSKIKINQNCGEMRSNKPPFNPHRILEFGFRNTSLDKLFSLAYSTDSGTSKLPKGILGWASGAERIERARAPLRSHALYDSPVTMQCNSIQYNTMWFDAMEKIWSLLFLCFRQTANHKLTYVSYVSLTHLSFVIRTV